MGLGYWEINASTFNQNLTKATGGTSGFTFANPASVIRPEATSFSTRLRFNFDHLLVLVRGVNFRAYRSSTRRLIMLSIQPTQSASSTAASYATQRRPVCFLSRILTRLPGLYSGSRRASSARIHDPQSAPAYNHLR